MILDRKPSGGQAKRLELVEIRLACSHCPELGSRDERVDARPLANLHRDGQMAQRLLNARRRATDVNVKLVLSSREPRIHGKRDFVEPRRQLASMRSGSPTS